MSDHDAHQAEEQTRREPEGAAEPGPAPADPGPAKGPAPAAATDELPDDPAELRKLLEMEQAATRELRERADRLRAEIQDDRLDRAVERAARRKNLDPALVLRLVDRTALGAGPDAEVTGAEAAVEELRKNHPSLARGKPREFIGGSPAAMRVKQPGSNGHANGVAPRGLPGPLGDYEAM